MDRPELEARSAAFATQEFAAKMGTVAEEADEGVYWLELITTTGYCDAEKAKPLLGEAKELRNIFAASYGTARRNLRRRRDGRQDQ